MKVLKPPERKYCFLEFFFCFLFFLFFFIYFFFLFLFTFITNSCTQLKHFHNFHLKLYTLKMFVMRTKTNLKPYMFRSVRRSSSGVISRALYHYYLSIFLLLRIPLMWRYVFCVCACAVLVGVSGCVLSLLYIYICI